MATLTPNYIKGLQPRKSSYRVFDTGVGGVSGLNIQVSSGGVRIWTLKYVDGYGRRRYHKVGRYPDLGIADARLLARGMRKNLLMTGEVVSSPEVVPPTFGELLDAYHRDCVGRGVRTMYQINCYRRKVPVSLEKKFAKDITTDDIFSLLKPISVSAPTMGNRVRSHLSTVFNFAINNRYDLSGGGVDWGVSVNPVVAIKKRVEAERPANVLLTMGQIGAMWRCLGGYSNPVMVAAIRFHIAMGGIRVQESTQRMWSDIVECEVNGRGVLCLCIERTKTGVPHVVPLGRHATNVLDSVRCWSGAGPAIFPSRTSPRTPLTYIAMGHVCRLIRGQHPECGPFSPRYMRAAAKTHLLDGGVGRIEVDRLHAHTIAGVNRISTKHYDKSEYLSDKLVAMDRWDELLDEAI